MSAISFYRCTDLEGLSVSLTHSHFLPHLKGFELMHKHTHTQAEDLIRKRGE
jgi:hypothetical protein